jgi:hypothetical protein
MELIELIKKRLAETTCSCGNSEHYQTHRINCIRAQFMWLLEEQKEQG